MSPAMICSQPSSKTDTEKPELKLTSSPQLPFMPSFLTWEMAPRETATYPSAASWGKQTMAAQM